MQGMQFAKEPSRNIMFWMIAQPANMLVHIVALNWCKNVVSETGLGKYYKQYSTLLKITYPNSTKSNLHDTVIFITESHVIQQIIASLSGENQCHGQKTLPGRQHFGPLHY